MIDSHHHFWKYNREQYVWMDDRMGSIRRDFLPDDLRAEIESVGIKAVVTVQARQTLEETEWLLELAHRHDFIRGVVGWVPLADWRVTEYLERFAGDPKLKAVRHVLHDEPDDHFMLRKDFNAGIATLPRFGLAYDILIFERHLPQTIEFVDRYPNQIFIVDHIAKPRIKDRLISPWREQIHRLAERHNVYCKISGMVTEADWHAWTIGDLEPYFFIVLSAFGPERLMFGSDWPVVRLASSYQRWFETVCNALSRLSDSEKQRIFEDTAVHAYKL